MRRKPSLPLLAMVDWPQSSCLILARPNHVRTTYGDTSYDGALSGPADSDGLHHHGKATPPGRSDYKFI